MQTHVAQLNLVVLIRIRSKAEFAILCLNSLTTKVSVSYQSATFMQQLYYVHWLW
jgi:hypothetical protein